MSIKRTLISVTAASLAISFGLAGCGGDPNLASSLQAYQQAYYQMINEQNHDCCCEEEDSESDSVPVSTPSAKPSSTPVSTTPGNNTTPSPKPSEPSDSGELSGKAKGQQIMAKILNVLKSANAIEAEVEKYEKGLANGKVTENGVKSYSRKPAQVKLEITYHTNPGSVGAKLLYNSGDKKVKIRPGGALSLITTDLDMTDDRVISPNNFTPAQSDLFGLVNHLSETGYEAEVTGKSTIYGTEIYILRINTSGKNKLHPDITHELVGFEPGTFKVRLWEAYTDAETKPFLKYNIKKLEIKDSLPDSIFKL